MDRQSGSKVFQPDPSPFQSPVETTRTKYDLQFEEALNNIFWEADLPIMYARELIQKFRENRARLHDALYGLENFHSGSSLPGKLGRRDTSDHVENARPRITVVEEATRRSWSPPPRRLPSPETIISRTTHDIPHAENQIVVRRRVSPDRPPRRRTHTGLTDDGDTISMPRRERSEERIEIRRMGQRTGRAYYEDSFIDRDDRQQSDAQSAGPKATTGNVTASGQEAPNRDIQDEADFYSKRVMERSYVGEAENGALRDWAVLEIPPGTKQVVMKGAGGGTLRVTWQLFNGVRRSRFYPQGIGNDDDVPDDASPNGVGGRSKTKTTTVEPIELERERNRERGHQTPMTKYPGAERKYFPDTIGGETEGEKEHLAKVREREKSVRFERLREPRTYRSSQQPFMNSYMRVNRKYLSPEALDYYRLDWQLDRDDTDFILIKENVSDDLQQRLFKYTQDLKGQKLIKNLAEFQDDDLENIIREARAANREPARAPPRVVERDREEAIKKLAEYQDDDLNNIIREARGAKSAPPREVDREREEIIITKSDRERSDPRYEIDDVVPQRYKDRYDDFREDPSEYYRERIIIRRDEEDDNRVSRISAPGDDDHRVSRRRSFERER